MSQCCVCMESTGEKSVALVNCGHVYHLSCIHKWFNCKKDASGSGRGGRRAPPHAPCPKCKEPFDMGSTVTIYLDLVKGSGSPRSAAKPKRRTEKGRASHGAPREGNDNDSSRDVIIPESPIGANANADAPDANRTNSTTNSMHIEEQLALMREEAQLASARAREAEDALAAEQIRRDAEIAEDRAMNADVSRLELELARAKTLLTDAKYSERQAVTKATRATDELTETRTEVQRLRGRVNALETQKKLERDLSENDGSARGEAELFKRFGESSGLDPRVAVETLCRALAGKNRQLHAQLEEYAKLTRNLRATEKALKSAEARNAVFREDVVSGNDAATPSDIARMTERNVSGVFPRKRAYAETHHDTYASVEAYASRVSRGWGREDGAYDDDERKMRLPTRGAGKKASSFPTAHASHGFGPLSRVPPVKSGKRREKGKSGEDLLDDILGSVDANASRAKKNAKTDTNKKPNGFDLASLASRRIRGENHENRIAIDLTADDASGGGGGSFIIHGADGRGGRTKIVRPGGGQSGKNAAASGGGGASGSLDRFLTRG